MPTDEVSAMDLLEQREKEAYEELGRLKHDDPNRKNLLSEVKIYSDIRVANNETEQARLNNNAKNDLEEERLIIEKQKLKNDKARIRWDFGKGVLYFLAGMTSGVSSYMLDSWFQNYKPLTRFQERLHDMITKK